VWTHLFIKFVPILNFQLFFSIFSEESIAISRSGIYDSAPNQCSHCGIRFITCETLRAHLKDHTAKNLKAIEAKREKEKEKKNRPLFNDLNVRKIIHNRENNTDFE